ncbi:MAG: hypothetical protein AB1384_06280 [Actinomycetota bacterium]
MNGRGSHARGAKTVVSIRIDQHTLSLLDEYSRSINEKMSSVARGFIVEGLERAGMGISSGELHELTRLRMKEELARPAGKIELEVRKGSLKDPRRARQDLTFWLGRPAEERVAAVDHLRRQRHGSGERFQRVARVVQRA